MAVLFTFFATISLVPYTYALGIFAVLCNDPGEDCSGWSAIYSAISNHPQTQFYLVINANDYCISSTGPQVRSRDACVPGLRPSNNPSTVVLGYVDTDLGSSKISSKIDTYAEWSSSSRPTGIFFDYTDANSIMRYQSDINYAKDKGFNFIALNAEDVPNSDYYSMANLIVTYESSYNAFQISRLRISPLTPASKQVVVLAHGPTSGYGEMISKLSSAGVAAAHITDVSYSADISDRWSEFVSEVAASGEVRPPASTPGEVPISSSATSEGTQSSIAVSGVHPTGPNSTIGSSNASGVHSYTSFGGVPLSTSPRGVSYTVSSSLPLGSATQISTDKPSSQDKTSSPPIGALVGGVLGGVILFLVLLLFVIWRRTRSPYSRGFSVDPFRSLRDQIHIDSNEKLRDNARLNEDVDAAQPAQPATQQGVEASRPFSLSVASGTESPPSYSASPADDNRRK